MPCIILTGHPNAGKSTLAEKIRAIALEKHGDAICNEVIIVDDDTVCPGIPMEMRYGTSLAEKKVRGALKSAFDRAVASNPSALIVLDSLNYIKGFRYELFCISKAASQKHCVVWVLNEALKGSISGGRYGKDLYDALIMRYESPDERNRWDRPLYRIDLQPEGPTVTAAREVLNQSVYNMHNLSAALASKEEASTHDGRTNSQTISVPQRTKSAASTFKKSSTFKRLAKTTKSDTVNSIGPSTLTMEALAAFDEGQNTLTMAGSLGSIQQSRSSNSIPCSIQKPGSVTIDKQIEEMLRSFLQDVEPLKQGTSTKQKVAADADVLHTIDVVTRAMVDSQDSTQREYMSWVTTQPPSDVSQKGIETSFQAFLAARKR